MTEKVGITTLTQVAHPPQDLSGFRPTEGRVWSLLDMLTNLGWFIETRDAIKICIAGLDRLEPDHTLGPKDQAALLKNFLAWGDLAEKGGFETMYATVHHASNALASNMIEIPNREAISRLRQLLENMDYDAQNRAFWLVHAKKLDLFDAGFSKKINQAFPEATWEIKEAGSCYALARNTASVFHLMRAVEHGMRALAVGVGVTGPTIPLEYQEWHNLIQQIQARSDACEQWGRGPELTNARQFFHRLIADLIAFKDDVRNVTMHTRSKPYNTATALGIRQKVRDWFTVLVTKVDAETKPGQVMDRSLFAP